MSDEFDLEFAEPEYIGVTIEAGGSATMVSPPTVIDHPGLDLTPIALNLAPYEQHVALLTQEAKEIIVCDAATQKTAVAATGRNKRLNKDLEDARKRFVAPYNNHVKSINNLFKVLQDPLTQNEVLIKTELAKYEHKLLLERRAEEARLREEQRQLQAKLEAEARAQREEAERKAKEAAEKLKTEQDAAARAALEQEIEEETLAAHAPTPQVAPITAEKPAVIRTTTGSASVRFEWACTIHDPQAVPREYCEPSQKLLNEAVKAGIRQIEGCTIEEKAIPVFRV